MNQRIPLLLAVFALGAAGIAGGQGMIMDMVVNKVLQKYESATCEQLWQQKSQPKSPEEQRAVQFLQERSAGAHGLPQQGRRSHRQQDVRMRNDSLIRGAQKSAGVVRTQTHSHREQEHETPSSMTGVAGFAAVLVASRWLSRRPPRSRSRASWARPARRPRSPETSCRRRRRSSAA